MSEGYAVVSPSTNSSFTAGTTQRKMPGEKRSTSDTKIRDFSERVMEKVKQKKVTSFEEIADEMYREMSHLEKRNPVNKRCKKKNISRRVYDILNVLESLEIVSKNKKEIRWLGPPSVPEEQLQLEQDKKELEESVQQKTADLQQLMLEMIAYKNLVRGKSEPNPPSSASATIDLPFIAVTTSKDTVISQAASKDKLHHVFNFTQPFEILDDMEVLTRMGMAFGLERNMCSENNLEVAKTMVSKELEPYLEELAKAGTLKNKNNNDSKSV